MNIVYISHDSNMWGANKSLLNLINGFSNYADVHIIVIAPSEGPMIEALGKMNVETIIVPFDPSSVRLDYNLKGIIKFLVKGLILSYKNHNALNRLYNILLNRKIDIVHTNTSINTIGYLLSKKLCAKHVLHLREFGSQHFQLYHFGLPNQYRRILEKSDLTIAITPSINKFYNLNNTITLFDAVHRKAEIQEIDFDKEPYFLFCGAITKAKGFETAIKALSLLLLDKEYANYKLKVFGEFVDNTYKVKIKTLISKMKLNNHIIFKGYEKKLDPYYRKSSGLLMCSKKEGMGRVTVEAMFAGCIVFGYNDGGTKDIICNNKTGFLYDTTSELVDKMKFSLKNSLQTTNNIIAAHRFVCDRFMEEEYTASIKELYKNILKDE